MLKIIVQGKEAQKVVLSTIYPDVNVNLRVEGNLVLEDLTDEMVSKIFKNLLEKDLVFAVTFSSEECETNLRKNKTVENVTKPMASESVSNTKASESISNTKTSERAFKTNVEIIMDFFKENAGKKFFIKELSKKLRMNYTTTATTMRNLYLQGKLERTESKQYFYVGKPNQLLEVETPVSSSMISLSSKSMLKKMEKWLLDKDCKPILEYIFPQKNTFLLEFLEKKFEKTLVTQIIQELTEAKVINVDEQFKGGGSYRVSKKWRVLFYLLKANKLVSADTIKVAIQMTQEDFNSAIKEALNEGLIKKEVDDVKKLTFYTVH